jgi:hypothetical protein
MASATDNICRQCFTPATSIRLTQKQQNGDVFVAIHEDGTKHTWLKYHSLLLNAKKSTKPRIINCPRCHKRGSVTQIRRDPKDPLKIGYVVRHEKTGGKWGRTHKVWKVRRCYFYDQDEIEIINKRLFKRYGEEQEEK